MNPFNYTPAQLRKVGVAIATTLTEAIALGLLDGTAEKVVLCVLAGAGTFGVFAVKNAA
ncbi:MAG TPA: hypothetical protein VFK41_03155 [Nocardioidaceae bacterium]|nr:hypothetical protein [Nocardioidaceae bacterium]